MADFIFLNGIDKYIFWYTIVLKLDERGINMLQVKYCLSMTENFYNKVKYNAEKALAKFQEFINLEEENT